MDTEKLKKIIESHGMWLRDEANGKRANLGGADLYGADLSGANLRRADLYGANLCEANLCEANLCEADLRRADPRRADLSGANLCEADLRRADLCEADLRRADLRRANLYGANLPEKIIQVGPIGSRKDYTIYYVDRDFVECGCWVDGNGNTLESFKKRINEVYPEGKYRQEYLAAIAMFELLKGESKHEEG